MIRTSPKFARTRVRNFIISIWITLIITLLHLTIQIKVIFNFSDHVLNTTEKYLLSKGLNFAILPKNINYTDFMLPFKLLYRDIDSLEVSNLHKEFIKSRLRDSAFSSYKDTGKILENNLAKEEFDALKILHKNKDIIVEKADCHSEQKRYLLCFVK